METPSETPSFPSPESIEAALRSSLEPTRRQSAARVADVTAAVVAHLVDVAAALQTSPGELEEATGASGTVARAWPSPASTASPGAHGDTTPASIAIARARLIGARVRAMAADADGVADAFAAATVAAFSNASENDLASFFADAEAFAAFDRKRRTTVTVDPSPMDVDGGASGSGSSRGDSPPKKGGDGKAIGVEQFSR